MKSKLVAMGVALLVLTSVPSAWCQNDVVCSQENWEKLLEVDASTWAKAFDKLAGQLVTGSFSPDVNFEAQYPGLMVPVASHAFQRSTRISPFFQELFKAYLDRYTVYSWNSWNILISDFAFSNDPISAKEITLYLSCHLSSHTVTFQKVSGGYLINQTEIGVLESPMSSELVQ